MMVATSQLTIFDILEAVDAVHRAKPRQDKCAWCMRDLGPKVPPAWIMDQIDLKITWRTNWRPKSAGPGPCVPIHPGCKRRAEANAPSLPAERGG